jgi:hypothetical protein
MNRWEQKATALWAAWVRVTGQPPPNMNALKLVLAQAQHESFAGDCWDFSHNWGCCDLRALNAAEVAAFKAGTLQVGMWLYPDGSYGATHRPDSVGTIRGDSDPNTGPFRVWFFAGPTDIDGAAYMLKAGVRQARSVLADPACTANTYAEALYVMCCYYGGVHAGARPCGPHRVEPLNAAEKANILDYANAILRNLPPIDAGLAGWTPPGDYATDAYVPHVDTPNAGDDIGQASVIEDAS